MMLPGRFCMQSSFSCMQLLYPFVGNSYVHVQVYISDVGNKKCMNFSDIIIACQTT